MMFARWSTSCLERGGIEMSMNTHSRRLRRKLRRQLRNKTLTGWAAVKAEFALRESHGKVVRI